MFRLIPLFFLATLMQLHHPKYSTIVAFSSSQCCAAISEREQNYFTCASRCDHRFSKSSSSSTQVTLRSVKHPIVGHEEKSTLLPSLLPRKVVFARNILKTPRKTVGLIIPEPWLIYSILSCFMYAAINIFTKLGLQTMDCNTFQVIKLPFQVLVTLLTAFKRMQIGPTNIISSQISQFISDRTFVDLIPAMLTGCACALVGFTLGDAFSLGGSASAVTVVSGSYPAVTYLISVGLKLEEIQGIKCLGVALAIGSCYCFAIA